MRRTPAIAVAGAAATFTLVFAACGERTAPLTAPHASLAAIASAACALDASGIYAQIALVFPAGNDRTAAEARFDNIDKLLERGSAGDSATAQDHALSLIEFTIRKYRADMLIAGTTTEDVGLLVNALLCYSGLPPNLDPNALGPDGAIALISPTTDTTLTTGTRWAGVDIDSGSVTRTVLVTITRVPPAGETLATNLDTYPLYYEFASLPATTFEDSIVVGVCQPEDLVLPDSVRDRLRLAHNVGPS
ncbi:MAG TPA: hypothetical protein VLA56_18290, partial [Pseudomonadales bacterium]|nr:hypothetical protein [Pseudomonadales bacterium]